MGWIPICPFPIAIMLATLAPLPPEILDEVLFSLDPIDVASFSQTCKKYYNFVYRPGDNHLWRALYLAQPFDDPRYSLTPRLDHIPPESIDWKGSLQAIIRARTVLADPSKCRPGERETILRTLIKLLRGAAPASPFCEKTRSANLIWLVKMLRDGLFLTDELPRSSAAELQLHAYLLVHLGLTPSDATSASKASARAFVYDMRNYCYASSFGPYLSDGSGRINWVHLYAIHRTIAMHLVDLREGEPFVFPVIPVSMPYCQSIIPRGLDLDKERDWAGVEGLWHCTFSFVDHRELLRKRCLLLSSVQSRPNPRRIE
jgi:F-box-like